MNVTIAEPAQIALRNLGEDNRRRVEVWIDNLKRWDSDPFVRQHSKKLGGYENVFMFITSADVRIFFALEQDAITVLEVAKRDTIISFGHISGAG